MFDVRLTFVSLFIDDAQDETTNILMRKLRFSYVVNYYFNMQDIKKWIPICTALNSFLEFVFRDFERRSKLPRRCN